MKHIGLFEGIGGFSLAARWMGWETLAWCEWNEFGQKVLRHHFPEAEGYGDIKQTDFKKYNGKIDIITGGFPCQPYSLAGKRKGKEDDRHLWPEMLRVIREVQPSYVVGENVFGLINWNGGPVFDEVQADLEAEGFEVWAYVLPACAINAPHRRDRVWFVAYSRHNTERKAGSCTNDEGSELTTIHKEGQRRECKTVFNSGLCDLQGTATNSDNPRTNNGIGTDGIGQEKNQGREKQPLLESREATLHTNNKGLEGIKDKRKIEGERKGEQQFSSRPICPNWENFPTQSPICNGDDGLSDRLDSITFPKWRTESIKAGGNAIVPQVAYEIFKVIAKMYKNKI